MCNYDATEECESARGWGGGWGVVGFNELTEKSTIEI